MSELQIPHIDEMAGLLYPNKKGLSVYHSARMDVAFLPPGADGGCKHGVIIWETCMACERIAKVNSRRHCHDCGQDPCICPAPLLRCNYCGAEAESLCRSRSRAHMSGVRSTFEAVTA